MVKVRYGKTEITGYLMGYSPGSEEFEIELDRGLKVLVPLKDTDPTVFTKMRVSMNAIGLVKLRSSILDFNNGSIEILDTDKTQPIKGQTPISTSFVV